MEEFKNLLRTVNGSYEDYVLAVAYGATRHNLVEEIESYIKENKDITEEDVLIKYHMLRLKQK